MLWRAFERKLSPKLDRGLIRTGRLRAQRWQPGIVRRQLAHIVVAQIGGQRLHDAAPPLALGMGLERIHEVVGRLAVQHRNEVAQR